MFRQDIVDQRLIADVPSLRFLPEILQYLRVDADRDELPRYFTERRSTYAPSPPQFFAGRFGDV